MAYNKYEGSFRPKKNGVEYRIYIDGQQKSFYGKTEKDCMIKFRKYCIEANHKKQQQERGDAISLQDYIQYWLTTYKMGSVSHTTYDRLECLYENHIKNSSIGIMSMCDITSDDIQEFINHKKQTMSLSSLKKIREILSPVFHHATVKGAIHKNPMQLVVFPKNDKSLPIKTKEIECYTEEEIDRIALTSTDPYYQHNPRRYRYAPLYSFILNTGLRLGECLALTWDDIDFTKKTINVDKTLVVIKNRDFESDSRKKLQVIGDTKTFNGNRLIPLNNVAESLLNEMKFRNAMLGIESNIVFPSYEGDYLNERSVQKVFKKICEDVKVEHKGIHALRHTFGSILIRKKIDIKVVSELLGHADVRFTYNRYIHIIREQKVKAMNILDVTPYLSEAIKLLHGKNKGTFLEGY